MSSFDESGSPTDCRYTVQATRSAVCRPAVKVQTGQPVNALSLQHAVIGLRIAVCIAARVHGGIEVHVTLTKSLVFHLTKQ